MIATPPEDLTVTTTTNVRLYLEGSPLTSIAMVRDLVLATARDWDYDQIQSALSLESGATEQTLRLSFVVMEVSCRLANQLQQHPAALMWRWAPVALEHEWADLCQMMPPNPSSN